LANRNIVVPELFALDPERLLRFKREARILASLNHPNIAAIYGFEETDVVGAVSLKLRSSEDGRLGGALILELVEGPRTVLSRPRWRADARRSRQRSDSRVQHPRQAVRRSLFAGSDPGGGAPGRTYDISPDGRRFLMIKENRSAETGPRNLVVVQNWFEELRQRVPTGN
jgi:hypothetical protein